MQKNQHALPSYIRQATIEELPEIVRVHQAAFPAFFLTLAGPAFLREYYRQVLIAPGGILLVSEQQGIIVGFVAGFVNPEQFYRDMRANKWRLAFPLLARVCVCPRLLPRILVNFLRVRRNSDQLRPYPGTAAELSSIGVDPAYGGRGAGKLLVAQFLQESADLGAGYVTLTTDTHENESVNRFYLKLGFRLLETFTQADGRVMNGYAIALNQVNT